MCDKSLDGFLLSVADFGEFILNPLERLHSVDARLGAGVFEVNVGYFLRTGHDVLDKCRIVWDYCVELEELENGSAWLNQHGGSKMRQPEFDYGSKGVRHLVHSSAVQRQDAVDLRGEQYFPSLIL